MVKQAEVVMEGAVWAEGAMEATSVEATAKVEAERNGVALEGAETETG